MNNKIRIVIEKAIARKFLEDAIAGGFVVEVPDCEGDESQNLRSTVISKLLEKMFEADDCRVYLYVADKHPRKRPTGWVYFVYGNDGWDVINDYTVNLEALLKGTLEFAEKIENGQFNIVAE